MKRNLLLAALSCASTIALAACDGGDSGSAPPPAPPPPPGPTAIEDQFGPGFGPLFRAGANTDPADPAANAIIAVDATRDATAVP